MEDVSALDPLKIPSEWAQVFGAASENFEASAAKYADLLEETNKKFNLTAIRERVAIWETLICPSLALLPEMDRHERNLRFENPEFDRRLSILDIGSGGGIPGIPLAIARPQWDFTLMESVGKKAKFLEEARGSLGLENVRVLSDRAEALGHDKKLRGSFDIVVMRFVCEAIVGVELALPFLRPMGWLLMAKFEGRETENEAREATHAAITLGGDDPELRPAPGGHLLIAVQKVGTTPRDFPRKPGIPKQRPLRP